MESLRPLMARAGAPLGHLRFFPCRKAKTRALALASLLALSVVLLVLLALGVLSLPVGPLFAPSRPCPDIKEEIGRRERP